MSLKEVTKMSYPYCHDEIEACPEINGTTLVTDVFDYLSFITGLPLRHTTLNDFEEKLREMYDE